jgi:hypothetical protein
MVSLLIIVREVHWRWGKLWKPLNRGTLHSMSSKAPLTIKKSVEVQLDAVYLVLQLDTET